jgi:hypothetical protein
MVVQMVASMAVQMADKTVVHWVVWMDTSWVVRSVAVIGKKVTTVIDND